jgi:hypothetical protein
MSTSFRGIGSETASVMLIIVGIAGYLLAPANVARLLTLFVIYLGARDIVAPLPARAPSTLMLLIGIWAALTAYGIFGLNFLNSWPLLIVLVGVSVIAQSFINRGHVRSGAESQ